ncbi:porin family protein [Spirosoma arcticum]
MDDSVDKQLADHVRETLDRYQTPYQLGAWEQFDRARQPAERRLGAWYRYMAAASVLGGMLLAPLWLDDARIPSLTTFSSVAIRSTQPGKASALKIKSPPLPAVLDTSSSGPVVAMSHHQTRTRPIRTGSSVNSVVNKTPPDAVPHVARFMPTNKTESGVLTGKSGFDSSAISRQLVNVTLGGLTNSVVSESGQPPTAPVVSGTTATQTTLISVATALAMTETAAPDKERERRRAVTWSLALAPQTAYIPNGRSSLTLGGGVVSDIALSRRLSVSTGLSVAQQTMGISPPVNQVMTTTGRQLKGTDARFVLIDLPLNLTYHVGKRTRPLFRVSAGLSSLAFLRQQFADTYQIPQILVTQVIDLNGRPQIVQQTTLIETVQTRPNTPFGGIYWGRLLNISVGIERPLSRRTVFAVEPYLKYPIGPLTQENLSIGSAGVSLRVGIR